MNMIIRPANVYQHPLNTMMSEVEVGTGINVISVKRACKMISTD